MSVSGSGEQGTGLKSDRTYYVQELDSKGTWYDIGEAYKDLPSAQQAAWDAWQASLLQKSYQVVNDLNQVQWGPTGAPNTNPATASTGTGLDLKRLWKDYEIIWVLMIAGFSSAVIAIVLMTWYKHGAPLPKAGA